MLNEARVGRDLAGNIQQWIAVIRDGLLVSLMGFGLWILSHLWPQIGAQLKSATIESLSFGDVLSIKLNSEAVSSFQSSGLTLDAVGGPADILEKGTPQDLAQAVLTPGGRFDMVGVSAGRTYVGDLLIAYISRLAPQFVIFRNAQKLEAWMDAGTFAAQLNPHTQYSYDALKRELHGLHTETIRQSASARDALEKMQSLHVDHLPAVDGENHFQFMLSREDILSKIVTSALLARKAPERK